MLPPLSEGALHLLAIDLPLACVLVAPLLLAANTLRGNRTPTLIVPAVILLVLGTSSVGAALLETEPAADLVLGSQSAAKVRVHQHELALLAMWVFAAAAVLYALALLAWRAVVVRMRHRSLMMASVSFGLAYVVAAVWLIFLAHRGAILADHLASHVRS